MMHGSEKNRLKFLEGIYAAAAEKWTRLFTTDSWPRKMGDCQNLFRRLAFAQAFQAIAEAALQWRGGVGIEGDEIPQGLAAIFAEPGQRGGVGVGVARDIFADGGVGMLG